MMTKDEALKMAIEHIERGGATTERKVVINACKEALDTEQVREDLPAQEPVAWMNVSKDAGFKQVTVFQEPTSKKSIPLYTHPHQWQGLTDERYEYRIKPQPKEPQYLYVSQGLDGNFSCRKERHGFEYIGEYIGKIKLEVDDA